MEIKLRTELLQTDPKTIYDIVKDTNFFRVEECIIARELAEETLEKPGEYNFIFAENDGETVAYACYAEIPGTVGSYDFYWLAVYRHFQRNGIGKCLIAAVEEEIKSKGGRQIYISTSGADLYNATRALYEKADYEKTAILKDFYLPGDDQVIYVKRLT